MSPLANERRAIRLLLDEREPADAMAVNYAYHHPESRTQIVTYPTDAGPGKATGYLALSRTGIDLFRPFVTLRLPHEDLDAGVSLVHAALQPGAAVILGAPAHYTPLLQALFEVQSEEQLRLLVLDRSRFEPIINVLVTRAESHNELPRFVVRRTVGNVAEVVASAMLNWRSPHFAEIAADTDPRYRRRGWGRSVVAAMVQSLIGHGRTPLYLAAENNEASIQLAQSVGFVDRGVRKIMIQGILKPHP
jgi:ribosomal protein S18 acetylase RimI-like enzyme